MRTPLDYPVTVSLELTEACNHRCAYCYNGDRLDGSIKPSPVDIGHFRKVLSALRELRPMRINMTGGEPLLRRDLVVETMKYCAEEHVDCTMNTNLALLEPTDVSAFREYGLRALLTSLYSWREDVHNRMVGRDSFRRLVQAMKMVTAAVEVAEVNMVVTGENFGDVLETGLFVKHELGANIFCVSPIQALIPRQTHLMLSLEQITAVMDSLLELHYMHEMKVEALTPLMLCMFPDPEKYRPLLTRHCTGGRSEWGICANGDLRPCPQMTAIRCNVLTHSYEQILEALRPWRVAPEAPDSIVPRECVSCSVVDICRGGCRSSLIGKKQDLRAKNPYMGKPVNSPLTRRVQLKNYLGDGFTDRLDPVRYREERGGYFCGIATKYLELTPAEFALLQLVKRDESLLRQDAAAFAERYSLDPARFNLFLNRIAESQPMLVTRYELKSEAEKVEAS
jgi:radical SAM protein with 4Fe4S-binding SPASM domain